MTSTRRFYYTVSGTSSWFINMVSSCLTDWDTPDYTYETNGEIFAEGIDIHDIFVTEEAASGYGNTIFIATSVGVYVLEESSLDFAVYYTV
jgi:hypothetical protein